MFTDTKPGQHHLSNPPATTHVVFELARPLDADLSESLSQVCMNSGETVYWPAVAFRNLLPK